MKTYPTTASEAASDRAEGGTSRSSVFPTVGVAPADAPVADADLLRIEAGLYPVCQQCGDRIEVDRLRADALATRCECCSRPNAVRRKRARS